MHGLQKLRFDTAKSVENSLQLHKNRKRGALATTRASQHGFQSEST